MLYFLAFCKVYTKRCNHMIEWPKSTSHYLLGGFSEPPCRYCICLFTLFTIQLITTTLHTNFMHSTYHWDQWTKITHINDSTRTKLITHFLQEGAKSPDSSESLSTEDSALWNNDQSLNYSVPIGNPKGSSKEGGNHVS